MSEAQEQTPSTTQESSTTQQNQQTQETPSLDQVYKQFNVEEAAQSFQPQQQQQQVQTEQPQRQGQEVTVPDPVLDADGFKKWAGSQSYTLQKALSSLQGELTAVRVERLRAREEADIKSAVEKFKSVAGEDVDSDMAEIALGQKARKDPKFLSVYQNRAKNPQAWSAAVAAYANEFKSKYQFKIDPQIAQNQQTARQSIGSQSKTKDEEVSGDEKLFQGKAGKDFERTWRNYVDRS